jgi:nucleoside-diphosphate-sugar epimerase
VYFGRCVVTGGRGFLGPYIVDALRAAGNHVVFVSRAEALEGNYDLLVHAAPTALEPYLGRCSRMIVLSSGAVTARGSSYLEGYADEKRILEADARANGAHIARIYSVLGPGVTRHKHFAATQFLEQAIAGGPVIAREAAIRSYLHPADVASALLAILEHGDLEPYDVGGEEVMNVSSLALRIAQQAGVFAQIDYSGASDDRYVPDLSRLHRLGWKQTISTDEAIALTLESLRVQA